MPKRILVIDDDQTICSLLDDTLTAAGYETIITHDALKGIEAAMGEKPPALILLDMQMPGGGATVFIQLGLDARTKGIPVFFTTALSESEVRGQIPNSPQCKGYFPKPFNFSAMLPAIEKVLSK
ncbi:MAG: response regulator [Elusimicrobia bacterium]|nr:response regulator [Elusimicrobiota bacterium]